MMAPLERNPRYFLLDAWRGVACLMVVLHHAGFAIHETDALGSDSGSWLRWFLVAFVRRMNLGVPLFFVISGYCIGASVDATRRRGSWSLAFLGRRLRRIYPPYWAALLGFVGLIAALDAFGLGQLHRSVVSLELKSPGKLTWPQWLGNATLTEIWRNRVGGGGIEIYTRIAWSLCYEEQFYFVCFLALALAPKRLVGALATVTALSALLALMAWDGWMQTLDGTFPYYWHEFAVGLAVYWRTNYKAGRAARRAVDAGVLGLALVSLYWNIPSTATAACFGLVLIGLRRWDERAEGLGWLRPLSACGRRCYSIYLVHLPVCVVVNAWLFDLGLRSFPARAYLMIPISSLASVGVSWLFFRWVESRFLNKPIARREAGGTSPVIQSPLAGEAAPAP